METVINKRNVWDAFIIVLITVAFGFSLNYAGTDFFCVVTFFINGAVSIFFMLLALNKSGISIELVYWIFMYFFMFFSPLIQYTREYFPWIHTSFSHNVIVTANITILVWNVIVGFITNFVFRKENVTLSADSIEKNDPLDDAEPVSLPFCRIITFVSLATAVVYFAANGMSVFGASRTSGALLFSSDESSLTTLLNKCMAALIHGTVIYDWYYMKQTRKKILFITSLGALLICLFPTRLARYLTAVIYGGLIIVFFKFVRKRSIFLWGFIAMFLIAFPVLGVFRGLSISEVDISMTLKRLFVNFYDSYTEGNYDAYTMLCSVIRYIILHGVTYGRQLLGCLLFFIPRSVWKMKPIGSGITVANYLGYSFGNVSCPLPAEFLINFGYPGVIVGSVIFGLAVNRLDAKYRSGQYRMFFRTMYPVIVMFIFFIMRGDLLSSLSYFMAYFAVFFAMAYVNGIITGDRKSQIVGNRGG